MKDLIKSHWDKSAKGYNAFVICSMQSKRRNAWKNVLREELGERVLRVLDIGTGPGIVAFILTELGHRATGIDLSEEMLKNARENAARFGLAAKFERGDAEELQFEECSFDALLAERFSGHFPIQRRPCGNGCGS